MPPPPPKVFKKGEKVFFSIWMTGEESEQEIQEFRSKKVPKLLADAEEYYGIALEAPAFETLYPGDPGVPPVPQHIKGIRVSLCVIRAAVRRVKFRTFKAQRFVPELKFEHLNFLRAVTRKAWANRYPQDPPLSDVLCDDIIERVGPEVARKQIDHAVSQGVIDKKIQV